MKIPERILSPLEIFHHWEQTTPQNVFLKQPIDGKWISWTYRQAGEEIRKIAAALKNYDLPSRSNIAILSKNCSHWIMADLAIWMAGHISVPLYPTLSASTIRQILEHSNSRILLVGKLDDFKIQKPGIPSSVRCISFTPFGEKEGDQWDDLLAKHKPIQETAQWQPHELATIKYTSGTTGNPKGVMISFEALSYVITYGLKGFALPPDPQRFFSYLPLSHVAERMLVEMGALYSGSIIHFTESLEKFPHNLMEVQPTVFLAVPRIWAKFREKIEEKMPKLDKFLKIPLISTIIKKAIRKKLGLSKAIWVFTGAAPISVELLEWFSRLGIVIHEVYGMTENLAYSHINLHEIKFGSVGKAWPDVFVKLSDEGEILVKHPGVMMGYYREPELSAEAFTSDGFLKTGDRGETDDNGFMTITGRVRDQFKTDKAKFVNPAPIELKLLMNADIEQVCVVGVGIPQPIALTILSASARNKSKEIIFESISRTIESVNPHLESYERIKAAVILPGDWTIENGLMTPTMKIKRNEVEKIHLRKYSEWYRKNEMVIWE